MTNREIEKLRQVAIEVAGVHDMDGVCGFHPGFKCNPCRHVPQVHLRYDEFCKTFGKRETVEHDEKHNEVFTMVDGVKFYALVEKSKLENGENHD